MVDPQLLEEARRKHKAGELESAERAYQEILDSEPNHPEALHLLGVIALQSGRSETAIVLLKQATEAKSGFSQALNNLGSAFAATRQHEEARAAYREALSIDNSFSDAHFNLGVSYQSSRNYKEALEAYDKALTTDPKLVDAELNRGISLRALERTEEAVSAFNHVIELDPGSAMAYLNLGLTFRQTGENNQAIDALKTATTLSPNQASAFVFLGQTLLWQGQNNEALAALEHAGELEPDSPSTQYELTKALFELGDRRAPDARLNLGIALLKSGEYDSAIEAFDANLALDNSRPTPELAMKVMALKEADKHQEMETLLGYDQLLRSATIDCPPGFDSLEDFNRALGKHVRSHQEALIGSGGPIETLEKIVTDTVTVMKSTASQAGTHPFITSAPDNFTVDLQCMTLTSSADQFPRFYPDAWLAGVYFVALAGSPTVEVSPNIEFGCPDPFYKEWMTTRELSTSEGKILLFPAFWFHRLPISDSEAETLAITIEVRPSG